MTAIVKSAKAVVAAAEAAVDRSNLCRHNDVQRGLVQIFLSVYIDILLCKAIDMTTLYF
jgi:hypothetical protein